MWKNSPITQIKARILSLVAGPQILAFVPALALAAFWLGGEPVLVIVSLGLPLLFAGSGAFRDWGKQQPVQPASTNGLVQADVFCPAIESRRKEANGAGESSACFLLELEDLRKIEGRHGLAAADLAAEQCSQRLLSVLRNQDLVARLDRNRIAVCPVASPKFDLEACIQLAGRMQSAVEEPTNLNGLKLYVSCSVGFCLSSDAPDHTGKEWLEAARLALSEARSHGPSTIRAFSKETRRRTIVQGDLCNEIQIALAAGQVRPWFQPQVSTDTGRITGFEALARWEHPTKGVLGPQTFLPLIEQAGLMGQLGQTMRHQVFSALKSWDRAGLCIPRAGVNFSAEELRDPGLAERLQWELDRFDLTPDRLAVEILETVFSYAPDDVISRTVTGLAKIGCYIDLDDFGTGHASIASLKRFDVSRIKIDRSFVTKADQDPTQQQLISAILTMAEQLKLETLAEGVETPGEHALMGQLGCRHVQGFGIGKPMPFDQTSGWIVAYQAKLAKTPEIGRKMG